MEKCWEFLNNKLNKEDIKALSSRYNVTSAIAIIMLNKGLDLESAGDFLCRNIKLYDPFLLKDMDKACKRIKNAIKCNEKITVYGDYDVDGVTSIVILVRYLKSIGANCDFYIPSRDIDGYGVNTCALDKISEGGTTLIITVDTGITAVLEAEYALKLGMDMVITDHHTVKEKLPDAYAVINPKRCDCTYPFKDLSGAGLAFKLVCALDGDSDKILNMYSDFAAIAAIADVVPLSGENRAIVFFGIEKIKKSPNIGIAALLREAAIDIGSVNSKNLAFVVAPRINAAGRIDSPYLAAELLLTDDLDKATKLSAKINIINENRKKIGEEIYYQALEDIETMGLDKNNVIVLARKNWHQGVIGIIASRLTEKYNKSVILFSVSDNCLKGSGRSIAGFNLFDALKYSADLIDKFGGHDRAAGLSLPIGNMDLLSERLNEYADKVLLDKDKACVLKVDMPLEFNGSLIRLLDDMKLLEPYGVGNEQPVFAILDCEIKSIRYSKDKKHIFLRIEKNAKTVDAVGFGMGNITKNGLKIGTKANIAANLFENRYNGSTYPQFQIIDIRW